MKDCNKFKFKIFGMRFINLQYANDTLIIGEEEPRHVIIIKWLLSRQGSKLTSIRVVLYFWDKVNTSKNFILDVLECKGEKLPIKYLGIPIKAGRLNKQDWTPLLETFEKRLKGWRGRLLPLAESFLLNAVLSALLTYLMSYSVLPRWVRETINRMGRNVTWWHRDRFANRKKYRV